MQGQHLTLRAGISGEDVRRSYSICSAVQDRRLRVAIKRVDGGMFSNWANDALQPGMTLEVMPPSGHFHVPLSEAHSKHYLAFAAGSGITPMLSIIKTTLMTEPDSRFTLFYGNRASSSVLFKEELEDLKDTYLERFNLVFILSREQLDIDLFNGRIDGDKVRALLRHWVRPQDIDVAFICGPHSMMEEVSQALQESGVDKARIKRELFATSIPAARPAAHAHKQVGKQQCEVTVIQDGRTRSSRWRRTRRRSSTPRWRRASSCLTRARAVSVPRAAASVSRVTSTWMSTSRSKTTKWRAASS